MSSKAPATETQVATMLFPSIETDQLASPAVAAVRAKLLDGLTTVPVFAEAIGRSERQVRIWLREGMPGMRVGKTPYIRIAEARAWIEGRSDAMERQMRRSPSRKAA